MPQCLLDTDTLSHVMRDITPSVRSHAVQYLSKHGHFRLSSITRFEILRGLKARNAARQLQDFEVFCSLNQVLPLTDTVIVRAADIYADLHRRGQLISDADILIAATALENRLTLVTSNTAHFRRIPGLVLDCWTTP